MNQLPLARVPRVGVRQWWHPMEGQVNEYSKDSRGYE